MIQLGKSSDRDRATVPAGGIGYNAYVWVDDVEALAREYRERGADVVEGAVKRSYDCQELVVRDCNGLVLCFGQEVGGG